MIDLKKANTFVYGVCSSCHHAVRLTVIAAWDIRTDFHNDGWICIQCPRTIVCEGGEVWLVPERDLEPHRENRSVSDVWGTASRPLTCPQCPHDVRDHVWKNGCDLCDCTNCQYPPEPPVWTAWGVRIIVLPSSVLP